MNSHTLPERVIRKLRSLRVKLAGGRPFKYQTPFGQRMCIPEDLNLANLYINQQSPEPDEILFTREWLNPSGLLLDIGANIGLYTMAAASLPSKVLSVEADPRLCSLLNRLAPHFPGSEIHVIQSAVADTTEGIDFWLAGESGENFRQSTLQPSGDYTPTRVPSTTIDVLAATAKEEPALIKIDVEGAELSCLKGATKTLDKKFLRAWIIEISRRHLECQGQCPTKVLSLFSPSLYDRFAISLCTGTDGTGHNFQELRRIIDTPSLGRLPWLFNFIAIPKKRNGRSIPQKFANLATTTG